MRRRGQVGHAYMPAKKEGRKLRTPLALLTMAAAGDREAASMTLSFWDRTMKARAGCGLTDSSSLRIGNLYLKVCFWGIARHGYR